MLHRIKYLLFISIFILSIACQEEEVISFSEVQEIVAQNCYSCHQSNGAAPFQLFSYDEIKRKAHTIQDVLENNIMPPWPADPNYRHFIGEKVLSKEDRIKVINWIKQGANKNVNDKIELPLLGTSNTALLETNSSVFFMKESISLEGDNLDKFYYSRIPIQLEKDTFIKSVTFLPGNRKRVHHMNGHWLNYQDDKKEDLIEGDAFVDAEEDTDLRRFLKLGVPHDDGSFPQLTPSVVNYLPGMEANYYPEGIGGFKANKKSSLLIQSIHYGPGGRDDEDLSGIEIHYAEKAPERPLKELQLGSLGVSPIEPEFILEPESKKKFKTEWLCDRDLSLLTIVPHMHLLGTKYKAYALSPQNDTIRLIKINNWDFRWQYVYTYPKIQVVPKGYRIIAEAEFDNTSSNPNQAFDPPREIVEPNSLNMKTTDEMFQLIMVYIDYRKGDEEISLE